MNMKTITGRDPRTGSCLAVAVDDGAIVRVDESNTDTDLFLSPGLIDLQVNGCAGLDVNDPQLTQRTVLDLVDAMLSRGVTCFAPTIITAPEASICHALEIIADSRRDHPRAAACIPFVHVEGPHISPLDGFRGAHPADAVRAPSIPEFERWQGASGDLVGMVTLSPHFKESVPYIAALVERGIHVAIGHTHAEAEEIRRAVDAGARLSTHLGNGIAQEIPRHRNPIWPQLADDRLSATFIADGQHLPPDVLKVMLRAKGPGRSLIVSDSVALAGMPAGVYHTPVGGRVELRADGRLCVLGSELLAGATASLAEGIGNLVRHVGMSLHDALTLATTNPGGFVHGRGQLTAGSRADLLRFRWKEAMLIEDVWLGGEPVYTRGAASSDDGRSRP
jgi:N-acetylglucosamine-6-phosphate deacetylase